MHLLELVLLHNIPLAYAEPAHEILVSAFATRLDIIAADGLSRTVWLQNSSIFVRSVTATHSHRPHYGIITTLSPYQLRLRY